ncbi:unnamed protein product [Amoebophrya sp. A25]|nr:unnamed protein product [Amoebophrya sp. A25]|eukprot:GSA25T00027220001.1
MKMSMSLSSVLQNFFFGEGSSMPQTVGELEEASMGYHPTSTSSSMSGSSSRRTSSFLGEETKSFLEAGESSLPSRRRPSSFLRFPETYPAANMPPEAAARKWAVIAADAQQQAQKIASEQAMLEQMSSSNLAKLLSLNQTAQQAAESAQRAAAASVAKDLGMSVAAIPTSSSLA